MDDHQIHAWGEPCGREGLTIPRAIALARAADRYPFATLTDVRRLGACEGLIFEFRVARPQRPPVPIRAREPVAIVIDPDDGAPPRALALRGDFPDALHFNLTVAGEPRELCLFDRPYREVRSRLTPPQLLDRVGEWLARAAIADLHSADQPLEPMLLNQDRVILDEDLLADAAAGPPILGAAVLSERPILLRLHRLPDDGVLRGAPGRRFLALALKLEPQAHRVLGQAPGDLAALVALLAGAEVDLLGAIGRFLRTLSDAERLAAHRDCSLVLLLEVPRTRVEGGPVEATEWWSFLIAAPLADVAVKADLMVETDAGGLGLFLGVPQPRGLESIPVAALRSTFTLTRARARAMSGSVGGSPRVAAIGAGALGSQVILNLARQGFGTWDIVDDDLLLPHNLARHALLRRHEGARKADALAGEVRALLGDEGAADALVADVMAPGDEAGRVGAALRDAGLILDLSAAAAVARHLALADAAAPRASAFIGPTGRHLVVLSEGAGRRVRLDDLEQQFAAGVAADDALRGLFDAEAGPVATAGSCREVAVQLPQDVVAIFAGVVAQFVKARHAAPGPSILIWEWSPGSLELRRHEVPALPVVVAEREGWAVRISPGAIAAMRALRSGRLPAETGGVLLGEFDHDRRVVYVARALPSPADGVERPDSFIRGAAGLREQVEAVAAASGGLLGYVGEWHSHPDGHDAAPSALDREAARALADEMGRVGLPALVLIQGEREQPGVLLST